MWRVLLCLVLCVVASNGVVVKLQKATNSVATTMAEVQRVRRLSSDAAPTNTTSVSFLELGEDAHGVLTPKKFGFKYLEYYGTVSIDDTSYSMLFDTSTAHTWVPSASCSTCCGKQKRIPGIHSPTSFPMFEQFADGTWYSGVSQTGRLVIGEPGDQLAVPNYLLYQILVKGRKHTAASDESADCSDSVIGLSFSSHATEYPMETQQQQTTRRELDMLERQQGQRMSFIDRLYHEHLMTAPIFTMLLTQDEKQSIIEFGSIDKSLVKRSLNPNGIFYVSAVGFPDFAWAFNVPRICIDDACVRAGNLPAMISSSVPYIALPQALYQAFRKPQERVPNPCEILKFLPTLSVVAVGSYEKTPSDRIAHRFDLCAKDYTLRAEDGSCDFAVVPTKRNEIILGTPFLRKFFTVFDIEQKRLGFAQSTEECKEPPPAGPDMGALLKLAQAIAGDKAGSLVEQFVKIAGGAPTEDKEKEPPLLRDNVFLTYHKRFVN